MALYLQKMFAIYIIIIYHLLYVMKTGAQQTRSFIYTIIILISVGVRKLQIAILARSSREMSLTVRNV